MVERLHRVRFGHLTLQGLAEGKARNLTPEEVSQCYLECVEQGEDKRSEDIQVPTVLCASIS